MTSPARRTPWTREQIQAARRASLPELLRTKGFHLRETGGGNYRIGEHPRVVVKDSYWRENGTEQAASPEPCRGGNAIDFCVVVLGMSFNQAMEAITR